MNQNTIFEYELKDDEMFVLSHGEQGRAKLLICSRDEKQKSIVEQANAKPKDLLEGEDRKLFEKLRTLRMEIADSEAVRPYMVFNDKTLVNMILAKPATKKDLLEISGVGAIKAEKYGDYFLKCMEQEQIAM